MKRIGPELKMPKLGGGGTKVPPVLSDLYADLRDRRLLPLVALILVAIVAAPFLLRGGADEVEVGPAPEPVTGGGQASARHLTVVKSAPGLRNYKKRLGHRNPTNPFKQRFSGPRLEGAKLNPQTTAPTGGDEGGGPIETETGPPASGGSPGPSTSTGGDGNGKGGGNSGNGDPVPSSGLTFYTFAINVQITKTVTAKNGRKEMTGPSLHKEVMPPANLPGEKAQVVTYMGISSKDHKPLFLVSPKVASAFGEGKCVSGEESCQLMELEPGLPETFVYGENQVRYKINVLKVVPKVTGHSDQP